MTPIEEALEEAMSEVSELAYAAGWMSGTEDAVYDLLYGDRDGWGMRNREEIRDELEEVRTLAETSGRWIVWRDGNAVAVDLAEFGANRDSRP